MWQPCELLYTCYLLTWLVGVEAGSVDWCEYDTGPAVFGDTTHDGDEVEFAAYVSRTRDGAVWLRFGPDGRALDWTYVDEPRRRYHTPVLTASDVDALARLNYSTTCVLTDLRMSVVAVASWHPTCVNSSLSLSSTFAVSMQQLAPDLRRLQLAPDVRHRQGP